MADENKQIRDTVFALKRLCISELALQNYIDRHNICGYSRERIRCFIQNPHKHTYEMIKIIRFIYLHSGYFRKLVQYFVNLPKSDCWTIDTEMKSYKMYGKESQKEIDKIGNAYFKYINEVSSYDLERELSRINTYVFLYDVCCAYIVDTDDGKMLHYFDPDDCIITGQVDGVFTFAIKKPSKEQLKIYPKQIQEWLEPILSYKNTKENRELLSEAYPYLYPNMLSRGYINVPYEKSFCIKYHETFSYIYPPFFFIVKEILDIEDFKDMEKTKVANEIYKLIAFEIPTTDTGQIAIGEDLVTPFSELARDTVSETIGILPTPFKPTPIEFASPTSNTINNVQNAIDELYSEIGVSKAMLAGASSGSELKISIEVDAGECYRILRQISRQINFHCKLRLPINKDYEFKFKYLDVTAHNQSDKVDEMYKLAQASFPVKKEVLALQGINPAKVYGNGFIENDVLQLGSNWNPLKTSYTMSGIDSDDVGRPEKGDTDISDITQTGRDNDSNDPDNRV